MTIDMEMVKLIIVVAGALFTVTNSLLAYFLKAKTDNIKANTTKEQRDAMLFWGKLAVNMAESLYKEKGSGVLKKEEVIKFLNDKGIKLSEREMDALIKGIVDEFNKNDWSIGLFDTAKVVKVGE